MSAEWNDEAGPVASGTGFFCSDASGDRPRVLLINPIADML